MYLIKFDNSENRNKTKKLNSFVLINHIMKRAGFRGEWGKSSTQTGQVPLVYPNTESQRTSYIFLPPRNFLLLNKCPEPPLIMILGSYSGPFLLPRLGIINQKRLKLLISILKLNHIFKQRNYISDFNHVIEKVINQKQ